MIGSQYIRGVKKVKVSVAGSGIMMLVEGTEIGNPELDISVELIDAWDALMPTLQIALTWS